MAWMHSEAQHEVSGWNWIDPLAIGVAERALIRTPYSVPASYSVAGGDRPVIHCDLIRALGCSDLACGSSARALAARLSPLAVAGIVAYLLDPVVSWLQTRGMTRLRSVLQCLRRILTAHYGPRLLSSSHRFRPSWATS